MLKPVLDLGLNTYLVSEPTWLAYLTYLVQLKLLIAAYSDRLF